MGTNVKTRLTWSLAILLALATIATSVSYVVSTHQAQAQETSQGLRQIALITGPNIPPRGLWAFDISYVDDQSQVYYLADASNASVDLIDTRTNTLTGQIGGFVGFTGAARRRDPGAYWWTTSVSCRLLMVTTPSRSSISPRTPLSPRCIPAARSGPMKWPTIHRINSCS